MTKVVVDRVAGDGAGEVGAFEGLEVEASRIAFVAKLCLKIGRETAHEGTDERSGNEYTHLSNILALGEVQLEEVVFDLRPVGQSLVDRARPRGGRHDHPMRRSDERRVGQERVSTCRSRWAPA